MSKQLYSGRYILKLNSSKLKYNDWSLNITLQQARENEELITLGDSQLLRFIREIADINYTEEDINSVKKEIKVLKKEVNNKQNRNKIKELYNKLDDMLYVPQLVSIVYNNKTDFDRATNRNGFYINGKKYIRLIGTTGGVKQSTILHCSEDIYKALNSRLENGRNKDLEIVAAKYEAYKSLSASVSSPVTKPKILVIKDGTTRIKDKVIRVSSDIDGNFEIDHNYDYEADKDFCDGCGMILPSLANQWAIDLGLYHLNKNGEKVANYTPSGFNTRYSFEKGMLGTFDFHTFASEVADTHMVEDAWGNMVDIRNVNVVLTTNMLKLWKAYKDIDDYVANCDKNNYLFSVTKVCPEELENKRNMNYQYLQSYEDISDKDINLLIKETVDNINGALGDDWAKAILFSKGIHITDKNIMCSDYDFIRALCVDEKVLSDSYIKSKIYGMIEKRIKDAKKGVLQVDGNYAIVLGDLYALCQSMFGLEITGLLKFGEFYSNHWNNKGVSEVIAFRSPMTSHNNIRKLKLINNNEVNKWFKYIKTCIIFNAWDTTTDALNGCDYDSDAIITSNNDVLLRNTQQKLAIVCEQSSVPKVKVTEKLIKMSNRNGFGSDIGQITNRVTAMYDVLASLERGSEEYNELTDRIILGQAYQQEAIDKIKGIKAKEMPKEWYDYRINKIKPEDDDVIKKTKLKNIKIMANKKPYFFIYNYDHVMSKYKKFLKNSKFNCMLRYGIRLNDLLNKQNRNEDEEIFARNYKLTSPVFQNQCCMNRICKCIEDEYKDVRFRVRNSSDFDYSIYKSDFKYKRATYSEIEQLYKEYKHKLREFKKTQDNGDNNRYIFVDDFKIKASGLCVNSEELCNIVLDMVYKNNSTTSKQFAWDVSGDQIIRNLLKKNGNKYRYPKINDNGNIDYNGYKFEIVEVESCEE